MVQGHRGVIHRVSEGYDSSSMNVVMNITVRFRWHLANIPDHSNLVNEENASLALIQQNLSLTLDL